MGIKSDADILQGLAEHRAASAGETVADEPEGGVGETMDVEPDEGDNETEPDADDEESEEETDDEAEEEEESEEESEEEEESDDEPEPEEEKPSNADKEIARIQEAEKEAKQRIGEKLKELEAERDALKTERAEVEERAKKADEIEAKNAKLEKLAKTNPVALGKSLGLKTPEEYMAFGAANYRYGKGLAPDAKPEHKQAAESITKDGEREQSLEEIRAELAQIKAEKAERETKEAEAAELATKQAEADKTLSEFASGVLAEATDDYPSAKLLFADKSVDAEQKIIDVAIRLATLTDSPPTAEQILDYIEFAERKKKSTTKAKPGTASENKKAPVKKKTKDQKTTGKKTSRKTDAQILKELEQRKAERKSA